MNISARQIARPPTLLSSFLLLAATDLGLRTLGFARTVELARKLSRAHQPADAALIVEVCRRLAMAAVFYPGRARCLEQSLALYVLLRRRGLPAELRLGVQPYPFTAHAWVELEGRPVNEQPEVVRQFVPMQDFAI
jgi:hypothetical protein